MASGDIIRAAYITVIGIGVLAGPEVIQHPIDTAKKHYASWKNPAAVTAKPTIDFAVPFDIPSPVSGVAYIHASVDLASKTMAAYVTLTGTTKAGFFTPSQPFNKTYPKEGIPIKGLDGLTLSGGTTGPSTSSYVPPITPVSPALVSKLFEVTPYELSSGKWALRNSSGTRFPSTLHFTNPQNATSFASVVNDIAKVYCESDSTYKLKLSNVNGWAQDINSTPRTDLDILTALEIRTAESRIKYNRSNSAEVRKLYTLR